MLLGPKVSLILRFLRFSPFQIRKKSYLSTKSCICSELNISAITFYLKCSSGGQSITLVIPTNGLTPADPS